MLRLVLAFVIGLPAVASAQELKYFYTRQDCGQSYPMFAPSMDYGEKPLFVGTSVILGVDGTPYQGGMMFTVNQDSGTWTLFTMYNDGTVCVVAFGENFEPAPN